MSQIKSSTTAKTLLKKALKEYRKEAGVSAPKDVMIDLLHIIGRSKDGNEWFINMAHEAYDGYEEERLYNEINKVYDMPLSQLPLYLESLEFKESKEILEERLRGLNND